MDITGGFVQVPNSFIEVMYKVKLNGTQHNIMNFIIRKTCGYQLESKSMSINYIANGIGISKSQAQKAIKQLIEANTIKVINEHSGSKSKEYAINENYKTWKNVREVNIKSKESVSEVSQSEYDKYPKQDTRAVPQSEYQLNTNKNKIINKRTYPVDFEKFYKAYPKSRNKSKTFEEWEKVISEHDPEKIMRAVNKYKQESSNSEAKYIIISYNFLGGERYLDYMEKEPDKMEKFSKEDWM